MRLVGTVLGYFCFLQVCAVLCHFVARHNLRRNQLRLGGLQPGSSVLCGSVLLHCCLPSCNPYLHAPAHLAGPNRCHTAAAAAPARRLARPAQPPLAAYAASNPCPLWLPPDRWPQFSCCSCRHSSPSSQMQWCTLASSAGWWAGTRLAGIDWALLCSRQGVVFPAGLGLRARCACSFDGVPAAPAARGKCLQLTLAAAPGCPLPPDCGTPIPTRWLAASAPLTHLVSPGLCRHLECSSSVPPCYC